MLVLAFHLAVPTSTGVQGSANDAAPRVSATAGSVGPASGHVETSRPADVEGPWLATQTFFHQDPSGIGCDTTETDSEAPSAGCASSLDLIHPSSIEACVKSASCGKTLARYFGVLNDDEHRPRIQYIIATIPDPLHTRLALSTDSSIETIEKAAFESHWEFAAQWLPWYDRSDPTEKDPAQRRKQRSLIREQECQPGLLVFRHGPVSTDAKSENAGGFRFDNDVLFVFLVGETPTAGINGVSFRLARAYMRAFSNPRDVRIAGPSFSGSYYSLSELILADQKLASPLNDQQDQADSSLRYVVRTGSATSSDAAEALKSTANVDIEVYGTGENSVDHARHFDRVRDDLGIDPGEAAILAEDDTAFSRQFGKSPRNKRRSQERSSQDTLVLRFPRDISHLRNVYKDLNQPNGELTAPSTVELSLKDTESGEDTVPTFSATQTPLAQNSVLEYIVSELRASRIRLVELAATNVLDAVFLVEVLRQQCPDIRLLVDQPDLLFVKAAQSEPLEGLLAISSYPLFPGSRHWSLDQTGSEKPIHESSGAEAFYNAIGSLLFAPGQLSKLNDYSWDGKDRPQTWLLELSRRGFSPIRLLPNQEDSWYYRNSTGISPATFRLPGPSALWFLLTITLTGFSLVLCYWVVHLNSHPCLLIGSLLATDGRHIGDAYRVMLLFFSLLILAVAQAVLYIPLLVAGTSNSIGDKLSHVVSLAGILAPLVFAVRLLKPIFSAPRVTTARYVYAAFGLAFTLLIPGLWFLACARIEGHTGFFLAMRALEMHVGPSPSLPMVILLSALLVICLCHLSRFHFLIGQRPRMFTAAIDQFSKGKLRSCRRSLNRILASPMGVNPRRQVSLVLSIITTFVFLDFLLGVHLKLSSNEGRLYDTITLLLLSIVISAIVLTACQVKQCWNALQQILIRLHALPLACSFRPVQTTGKSGPVWARRFNLQSLNIPTMSIVALHNLRVAADDSTYSGDPVNSERVVKWFDSYRETLGNLIAGRRLVPREGTFPKDEQLDRTAIRKEFGKLRYQGAAISHDLNGSVIVPDWSRSALSLRTPVLADKTQSENDCVELKPPSISETAQTFVALQYSMFINYGVRQIQNLLLAVSVGYGLLVAALNVYAFEASHLINRFLLAGFVVLGIVIWQAMSQMERDPILSRLSGSTEGELSREFYVKLIGYGALPLLTVLSSQFPAIGHFLTSWVEPSLEAFK